MITLSLVIPVYSGEAFLEKLVEEIDRVRSRWLELGYPFRLCEAIFVDDDSIDNSRHVLKKLSETRPWLTVLQLSRNFGQHPATVAGILHSSGNWVVTLDEDLQHPPGKILTLLERAARESLDLVYASPKGNVHGKAYRDFSSRMVKKSIAWATGNPHITKANSFRLIRGDVARAAASACNFETYLDVALYWFTKSVDSIDMDLTDTRFVATAKSGYSFRSLVSHARRMVISSQLKLLRVGAVMGMGAVFLTFGMGVYVLVQRVVNPDSVPIQGWTSLIMSIYFLSGVILLLLSIMMELVSTVVQSTLGKPSYFTVDRSNDQVLRDFFEKNLNAASDA